MKHRNRLALAAIVPLLTVFPLQTDAKTVRSTVVLETGNIVQEGGTNLTLGNISTVPKLGVNGELLFTGEVSGPGISGDDVFALMRSDGTTIRTVARLGQPAPPPGSGNVWTRRGSSPSLIAALREPTVSATGEIAFRGVSTNTPGLDSIFRETAGQLTRVIGNSDLAPQIPGEQIDIVFGPQIDGDGNTLFPAILDEFGSSTVTSANDGVIYRTTSTGFEIIAREGDPLPSDTSRLFDFLFLQRTGEDGTAMITASFRDAVSGTTLDGTTLFAVTAAGGLQPLVSTGAPVAGLPGVTIDSISRTFRNADGEIAFRTRLAGTGVTGENDDAIVIETPAGFEIVMRQGDPVPGVPGAVFGRFIDLAGFNANGTVMFEALLVDAVTGDLLREDGRTVASIFTWTAGTLELAALSGDTLDLGGGRFEKVTSISAFDSLRPDGEVGFLASFAGGGEAFVFTGPGGRTADPATVIPLPASAWLLLAGVGGLVVVRGGRARGV